MYVIAGRGEDAPITYLEPITMPNTQHTPGPWQVNSFDPLQVCDADGERRGCAPIATTHGRAAEARANARLIASAPALLDALTAMVNYSNLGAYDRAAAMSAARAAIRQANGQE